MTFIYLATNQFKIFKCQKFAFLNEKISKCIIEPSEPLYYLIQFYQGKKSKFCSELLAGQKQKQTNEKIA